MVVLATVDTLKAKTFKKIKLINNLVFLISASFLAVDTQQGINSASPNFKYKCDLN